ncbi:hypothetical protein G6011_07460 [Alternaria panax]|uniref:BAH domain-containing protein n=1 Tax=Alternaria panax TaxID=48097 RepID=A0AAD4FEU5_9PLEO|nr:hypothetical protein G6011_07460 [Alternaria panax]
MARKRKVADEKPAHTGSTPSTRDATDPVPKKRKIDWSTVDNFPGFKVIGVDAKAQKKSSKALTTKEKRSENGWENDKYPGHLAPLAADIVQPNPFQGPQLGDLHVKISPARYWESTNRYRKFTINGEEFQVGQMVFVKKSEDQIEECPNSIQHWLAKVLEIRAGDASHVYLRVFWAYRPEDVPGGRKPHHGGSELIVSNHMDIIEAVTVESSADVVYWNDDPDSMALQTDQLFFRQSYDITKKINRLSKLNTYCIDKQPSNPDELLVQCPHCSEWLHANCLKERALQEIRAKEETTPPKQKKRGRPSKGEAASRQSKSARTFDAQIKGGSKTRLTIMEKHEGKTKRKWNVDIPCLVCGDMIEKAGDAASEKPVSEKPAPLTPAAQVGDDALEDDKEEQDNTTPTKTSSVNKTPTKDGDADSVIGDAEDDQDAEIKAESKVLRKKGRPLGSTNRKRKRAAYGTTQKKYALPHAKVRKTRTGKKGAPLDTVQDVVASAMVPTTATTALESTDGAMTTRTESTSTQATFESAPTKSEPAEETFAIAAPKTPAPAPITESIFQSGVRSVKRLLWRA